MVRVGGAPGGVQRPRRIGRANGAAALLPPAGMQPFRLPPTLPGFQIRAISEEEYHIQSILQCVLVFFVSSTIDLLSKPHASMTRNVSESVLAC